MIFGLLERNSAISPSINSPFLNRKISHGNCLAFQKGTFVKIKGATQYLTFKRHLFPPEICYYWHRSNGNAATFLHLPYYDASILAAAYEKEARDAQNKAREEQLKKLQDQKAITENWLSSVLKDPDQEKWVKNNLLKSFELAKKIGEEISRVGEDAWNTNEEIRKGVFRMLLSGDGSRESAWNQILEAFKNWKFKASGVYNIGWAIDDIAWALLSTDINKLSENINKGLDMLCQWVSFGLKGKKSCKGLPVPFNQAFLAPWDYHVMWCIPIPPLTRTLGKGIPVFHFPGTLPTPVGNIPFPRGQKGPWDEFLWVGWWIYPSLIRIYAAPTLTAQLGLAICAGPQKLALAMKSPFADLGGNCIVTAFSLPCWDWEGDGNSNGDGEWYDNWAGEYWSTNTCSDSTNTGSPLRNVGFNWISKNTEIKLPVIGIFNAFTPHYEPSNFWNNDFSVGKNTMSLIYKNRRSKWHEE